MLMKKKMNIFISMCFVAFCFVLSTTVASAQTAAKTKDTNITNNAPAGTIYLSDIVAANNAMNSGEVVKVPPVTVTGNQSVDNANYIAFMKTWIDEHKADYYKIDQKTRTIWESGDYNYFVQFQMGLGNYVKAIGN